MSTCSDEAQEGEWLNYYTGEQVDLSFGVDGLNGGTKENCGIMEANWSGWRDFICDFYFLITCACQHPEQMYLRLRGLCPASNLDRWYVPRNKKRSGSFQLIGFKTTVIEYEKDTFSWRLLEHSQNTTAVSKASQASYVLGSHRWTIAGDSNDCSPNGEPYHRVLKLTGCREGQFTCSDGQCIRNIIVSIYQPQQNNLVKIQAELVDTITPYTVWRRDVTK